MQLAASVKIEEHRQCEECTGYCGNICVSNPLFSINRTEFVIGYLFSGETVIVVEMNSDTEKRLEQLEILLEKKQRHSNRLCWIKWDPNSDFGYDIEDAREDIYWMIHEIRRLREENIELKAFADSFRETVEKELGLPGKPGGE